MKNKHMAGTMQLNSTTAEAELARIVDHELHTCRCFDAISTKAN